MKGRMRRISAVWLAVCVLANTATELHGFTDLPQVLPYDDPPGRDFVPLTPPPVKRRRRDAAADDDEGDFDPAMWTPPPDVDVQADTVDHQYYIVNTYSGDAELQKRWVDVDKMLDKPGVVGNRSHPLLSKSYRRAVGSRISFPFPFYGQKMNNLTIATGGFIYIGDQTHNWLAATQYIAPLMANFHTNLNNSNIIFADDGKMFVVEWRRVQLREESHFSKMFSFQALLHKNGDIVFLYKDVPVPVENISDANHPVKLGISDAYLYEHSVESPYPPKRVIYEYHRIELPLKKIASNTVVVLSAQPTCLMLESCEQCTNATLKHFSCTWCHAKSKHGGPFCTDEFGLHRRRQHWVEGNCKANQKSVCSGKDDDEIDDDEDFRPSTGGPTKGAPRTLPDKVVVFPDASKNKDSGGSNIAALLMMFGSAVCLVAWLAYAYYNPHTTSGQMLIKYRPSRWHVPSSHVRYSASVHM